MENREDNDLMLSVRPSGNGVQHLRAGCPAEVAALDGRKASILHAIDGYEQMMNLILDESLVDGRQLYLSLATEFNRVRRGVVTSLGNSSSGNA